MKYIKTIDNNSLYIEPDIINYGSFPKYEKYGSIILIENPEYCIHHPKYQADLADLIIKIINSNKNIQIVVDTHSECFFRRIQRRIAEDKLSHEKVLAYFVNTNNFPYTIEDLQIDMFGDIHSSTNKLFGHEMNDIIEHAKASMKKRIKIKYENDNLKKIEE